MDVELPRNVAAVCNPCGGTLQIDDLMLLGTHSTKKSQFLSYTFNMCLSTSSVLIFPQYDVDATKHHPYYGSELHIMFLALKIYLVKSRTFKFLYYSFSRGIRGEKPIIKK